MKNVEISVPYYDHGLPLIDKIFQLIDKSFSHLFHSVIVHGSVATNEVISYSDFDGLLIIKDKFYESKELKNFKKKSIKLIYEFDPFQHHGWFQIKESDLDNYSESFLPLEVFRNSKIIYPLVDKMNIHFKCHEIDDYKTNLNRLLDTFEFRLQNDIKPQNMFELKSLLSQIMILPCLWYSALNNQGIFKKDSFPLMEKLVNQDLWSPIDIASEIRSNWNYKLNIFQRLALTYPNEKRFRKLLRLIFSPNIDSNLKRMIDENFMLNLKRLIIKIREDIS
tara:strand:+ start:96 stop:932 length:837 start_codon:yes stop_codon:yes gene_type:complete